VAHKCPACRRRVRSAPYVSLQDRRTRKIIRYHGGAAPCLQAGVEEAQRRGLGEIVLGSYHSVKCGDPSGRMSCQGGCFKVDEAA
jgi:hypothetical protein